MRTQDIFRNYSHIFNLDHVHHMVLSSFKALLVCRKNPRRGEISIATTADLHHQTTSIDPSTFENFFLQSERRRKEGLNAGGERNDRLLNSLSRSSGCQESGSLF